METKKFSHSIGEKVFHVEINNWAEQANGSVLVRLGDTVLLATAVMNLSPREGGDFFPLTVDYEERFSAAGKILGSRFIKRETRPSEEATLLMRLIDRTLRPRFEKRMRNEIQVVITALSIDEENDPDVAAILGASLALSLSDIPWDGPVAAIRVGRNEGKFIAAPTYEERGLGDLDLMISGTAELINMMEAGANEIPENDFAEAVEWGIPHMQSLVGFQKEIMAELPREKAIVPIAQIPKEFEKLIKKDFSAKIEKAIYQENKGKMKELVTSVKREWMARAEELHPEIFQKNAAEFVFEEEINDIIHKRTIGKGERPDGRKPDEIRQLSSSVGVLPRVHGSGLFMRGETHALSTLTLGAPGEELIIEGMEVRTKKRFIHHYNFPPYSVGETKPMRGPGRREIGHGALVHKALLPIVPSKEEFPYTIRIVSEILSSNGSTSMASVCGSTLALMDAGVPIKKPVAGAAMGLMRNKMGEYRVLTDLQGQEDHHGDMDFKIAGTRDGITAVQLDVKIDGLTPQMIRDTLAQAYAARMKILDLIVSTISEPRAELSPWAPRVTTLKINPEKIGALIGPGGKVINDIIAQTGAIIDIEDDGTVFITSDKEDGMKKALSLIKQITREIKAGELVEGKVTRIMDFGAVVEFAPRQDGLVHISELAPWRVEKVTDILRLGDTVTVKVKSVDEQGKVSLSLKDVPGKYSDEDIKKGRGEERYGFHHDRQDRRHRK